MVSLTPQPPPCLGGKVLRDKEKTFLWPPRKEFFKEYSNFFGQRKNKLKILSLTQAMDINICMHGYGHICIAIDISAKYHIQA